MSSDERCPVTNISLSGFEENTKNDTFVDSDLRISEDSLLIETTAPRFLKFNIKASSEYKSTW